VEMSVRVQIVWTDLIHLLVQMIRVEPLVMQEENNGR
jgi:hypothetical protein